MDEERLNRAVRGIRMPEDARQRLLHRLKEERPRRVVRLPKRPALAAVAACLALALGPVSYTHLDVYKRQARWYRV